MEEGEQKFVDLVRHLKAINISDEEILKSLKDQGCDGDKAFLLLNESGKELERDKIANLIVKHNLKLFLLAIIVVLVFIAVFAKDAFKHFFPIVMAIAILCIGFASILRTFVMLYSHKYDFTHRPTATDDLLFGTIIGVISFALMGVNIILYIFCMVTLMMFILIAAYRMVPLEAVLEIIIMIVIALVFKTFLPKAIELFVVLTGLII